MFSSYYEWTARQRQKELMRPAPRREPVRLVAVKMPRLRWRFTR